MDAPDWYAAWRHDAFHELMAKQDVLRQTYRINEWPRFDYDVNAGTLTFSEEGVVKVVADIQVVGTTSPHDWLWSWANDHWPAPCVKDMHRVRAFGLEHGIEELSSDYLAEDDLNHLGWQMAAVATRVLDAVGAYRPTPRDGGSVFLLCQSIRFVS